MISASSRNTARTGLRSHGASHESVRRLCIRPEQEQVGRRLYGFQTECEWGFDSFVSLF